MKHFYLLGFALLVALLLPKGAVAQPWPDPVPTRELPEIHIDTMPFSGGPNKYSNYFKFSLKWPTSSTVTDTLHNPPHPINLAQTEKARWQYFWKFGDGTYSTDSMPVHAFSYQTGTISKQYDVEVSLKPIYSDDYDPFKKKKKKKVGIPPKNNDASQPPYMNNINYSMIPSQGSAIELQANWRATRPGKGLTLAITYKSIVEGPVSGVVGFYGVDGIMVIDAVEGAPEVGEIVTVDSGEQTIYPLQGLKWHFDGLRSSDGERTIFLDVRVPDNISQLINDTSSIQRPVFAYIGYNDPNSGNPATSLSLLGLLGLSKSKDNNPGVPASDGEPYNFYQEITEPVSINWAADPNYILVNPTYLEPGTMDQTLDYSVHFQNDGSASAMGIDVEMHVDPLLVGIGANQPNNTSIPACLKPVVGTDTTRLYWKIPTTLMGSSGCQLNGVGDAVALGFSTDATWGKVNYDIRTLRTQPLRAGEIIRAHGTIKMDGRSEATPVAIVPVGIPSFCYPGILGLKYTQHFANEAVRSGWGLGLTLRYGLGKVQNPNFEAHTKRRINKQNFPLFWWQGELGYGETSLRPGADSLRVCHLDFSPLTLRFIAKKPALPLGGLVVERGWGISAGYTASYLLASRRNGTDDPTLDQLGFGQRLDHSIAVSADFLNLIGRPGISFGAGWRWRNSNITGTREWYQNAFVYLHYTFSPRFRTEFGWLK